MTTRTDTPAADEVTLLKKQVAELEQELSKREQALAAYQQQPEQATYQRQTSYKQRFNSFQALVEKTPDAVVIADVHGIITYTNPAYRAMIGYRHEPGERTLNEIHAGQPDDLTRMIEEILVDGAWEGVLRLKRQDGSTFQGQVSGTLLLDDHDQPQAIAGIIRDVTEHREIEDALQRSRAILRACLDHLPAIVFVKDISGKFLLVNQRFARTLKCAPQQVVGKYDYELFAADTVQHWREQESSILATRQPCEIEDDVFDDAEQQTFLTVRFPIYDEQGAMYAIGSIATDITERKHMEAVVRENEERFRLMAEHAQDIIYRYRLTQQRGYEYISPSVISVTGYSPEEYYSDPDLDLKMLHPDSQPLFETMNQSSTVSHEPLVLPIVHKDGRKIWIEQRHWLIYDGNGTPVAFEGITRDITQQKLTLDELQKSEERFRLLAEHAQDIVYRYRLKPERGFEYISPSVTSITGYTPEEFYADPDFDLTLLQFNDSRLFDVMPQVTEEVYEPLVLLVCRKDGKYVWLEQRNWQVYDQDGRPIAIEGIARDITGRKHAEEAMRQSEARYRAISELISDYVYAFQVKPDGELVLEWMTDGFARNTGFTTEKMMTVEGRMNLIHPDDLAVYEHYIQELLANRRGVSEYRILTRNGDIRWINSHGQPVWDETQDRVVRIYGASQDITERKRAENALYDAHMELKLRVAELEQHYRDVTLINGMSASLQNCRAIEDIYSVATRFVSLLFEHQSGALYVLYPESQHLHAVTWWGDDPPGEQTFPVDQCMAMQRREMFVVDDIWTMQPCTHVATNQRLAHICVPLMAQAELLGMLHLRSQDIGSDQIRERWEWLVLMVAEHLALALANWQLRERLREQSIRDPLTALFNRRYMTETLDRELKQALRHHSPVGIIMLDIDHFKQFNDTYGHDAGDVVLNTVGTFLQKSIREEDVACRYGGEEFLLILPGASLDDTLKRAEQLHDTIREIQLVYEEKPLRAITISVGVASFPEHGRTVEDVLRVVDDALYSAKREGRNQVIVARTASPM
jgi:diguanylate cyclase (GGDEF)-like protein/PAS domain S-box-containing protein